LISYSFSELKVKSSSGDLLPINQLLLSDLEHANSLGIKSNRNIYYQIGVVDLDPKPLKKLDHYYELDQKIVDYYLKYKNNKIP